MPTNNKVTASSKVRNSKVKSNTGKNAFSELQLVVSFAPLFSSKEGQVRLTFFGV